MFWDEQEERAFIGKTVGVQALFDVLRLLLGQGHIEIEGARKKAFLDLLSPVAVVDFSDAFFQASGTGRTRIRNVLLLGISERSLDSLSVNEVDRGHYERLLEGVIE